MSENTPVNIWRLVTGNEVAIANHLRGLAPVLQSSSAQRVTRVARQLEQIHKLSLIHI